MTLHERDPVMRRKVTSRRPPPEVETPADASPGAALVRAFSRAVSKAAPLVAEGGGLQRRRASLAELLDSIDPDAFVLVLSGPNGPGLAVIDQVGFATVIEAMTIGRLGARPPQPRRPTGTDSALLGELIDATLADLAAEDPVQPYRMARAVPDHRLLGVMLDDCLHDQVAMTVTLTSGKVQRPFTLSLAIPRAVEAPRQPAATPEQVQDSWSDALEASVLQAPASLRAELGRVTMPLSEAMALGVGSVLILPLSNLEDVKLVALDGYQHAVGRLGQSRGMRAVRLTVWPGGLPPDPTMVDAMPNKRPEDPGGG